MIDGKAIYFIIALLLDYREDCCLIAGSYLINTVDIDLV